MCACIVCVYVCIHVMRVVRLPHKLTYCFFPFSWVDPTHSGGGATNPDTGIIYIILYTQYIMSCLSSHKDHIHNIYICIVYIVCDPCYPLLKPFEGRFNAGARQTLADTPALRLRDAFHPKRLKPLAA